MGSTLLFIEKATHDPLHLWVISRIWGFGIYSLGVSSPLILDGGGVDGDAAGALLGGGVDLAARTTKRPRSVVVEDAAAARCGAG